MEEAIKSQVKLTKHQATAIKAEMQEIVQMQSHPAVVALNAKLTSYRRFIEALALDADQAPDAFMNAGIYEEGGEIYLRSA